MVETNWSMLKNGNKATSGAHKTLKFVLLTTSHSTSSTSMWKQRVRAFLEVLDAIFGGLQEEK
jgi:hypothetical protein